jgi:hypothetical protein
MQQEGLEQLEPNLELAYSSDKYAASAFHRTVNNGG